jgi:hypothetical protein
MADLKEDAALISASIAAGAGAFLSWFYQSSVFGTITGVVIGAAIGYFAQTKTQNRLWKREYTIKITEQVYGELFGEIKTILCNLESGFLGDVNIQGKWTQIQSDHRYFMVDQKFRENIDQFYNSLSSYNSAINKFDSATESILRKSANRIYNKMPQDTPNLTFTYFTGGNQHIIGLATPSNLRHLETLPEIEQEALQFVEQSIVTDKTFTLYFDNNKFQDDNQKRVFAYWASCLALFKENENFIYAIKEKQNLLKQAIEIKSSLEKRISEPWKV